MRIRVKFCGIATRRDAEAAVEAGADALGFVLWSGSPRAVTVDEAARLAACCPPHVARVGVFVNEPGPSLLAAARAARLSVAQLHGDETPGFAASLDIEWYRAFRVADQDDPVAVVAEIRRFGGRTFMLDARAGEARGGTGRAVDTTLAAEIGRRAASGDAASAGRTRMILAGGLTPHNVGETVRSLREAGLWAVDVSSGVETVPAVKDRDAMRRFVDAVRDAQ